MIQCPSCNTRSDDGAKFCPKCGGVLVRAPGLSDEDQVGRIIAGKFRIEALIGEGGMGKVFRATQMSLDKTVVLKVLRQSLLGDARTVARFQREAKAASRLNHPNSISVIDFGQSDDGSLFIAMEYVAGEDLHQLLSREGPLPQRRICKILGQVLSALADAHAAGVIHRDLKPENIMVEQRRGEPDFVKVLDFGIAKIQESEGHGDGGPALTRAGFVCGTPEYMSPEQARGIALDARTDLYAVGVIGYQCATNQLPFEADNPVALATMHLTTQPPPPREKRPDAPITDAMEALILKAMAKDPNERPQTAEDFRRELLALEGEFEATRVQTLPPPPMRNSGSLRKVKGARSGSGHAAPPVQSEASMPTWASSPGDAGDATSVTAESSSGERLVPRKKAKPKPKGAGSQVAIFVGVLLGTAAVALGALKGYQSLTARPSQVVVADTPKPPPPDLDLSTDPAEEVGKREAARRVREAVEEGDQAVARGEVAAGLQAYLRAAEVDANPGHLVKRITMVYLMQGDVARAKSWMERYAKSKGEPDLEYFKRGLEVSK